MKLVRLELLQSVLGDSFVPPGALRSVIPDGAEFSAPLPFSADEVHVTGKGADRRVELPKLLELVARGEMLLIPRIAEAGGKPLTIASLVERYPEAFESRLLKQVGYQLKEEWGILIEPLSLTETPAPGWAVVAKRPLARTLNRTYEEQTRILDEWASPWTQDGWTVRRRRAVEIVYDLILLWKIRGERLLEKQWDWSTSRTVDRGIVNVGGFGLRGMEILAYSAAVRHGALGVCPNLSRD